MEFSCVILRSPYVAEFGKFLNCLEMSGTLARSICFNLNARDNAALAALVNTFNDGSTEGKMQYGPAWWFLDQKGGIEEQLDSFSVYGVLGTFIGMLTDSRSFQIGRAPGRERGGRYG